MLNPQISDTVAQQLKVASEEADQRLSKDALQISMTLTGAGAHGGGRHQVLIIERIVQEVEARADLIWALFQKAAEAFGVSNYPALADEVKGFLQKCLIDINIPQ